MAKRKGSGKRREKKQKPRVDGGETRPPTTEVKVPLVQAAGDEQNPFTVERLESALGVSIEEVNRLRREVETAISRAFEAEARARELEHERFADREQADETASEARELSERLADAEARAQAGAERLEELKREAVKQAERAAREAEEATRVAAEDALRRTGAKARAELRRLKGEIRNLQAKLDHEMTQSVAREKAVRAAAEALATEAIIETEKAVRRAVRKVVSGMDEQARREAGRLDKARREDGPEERMRRAVLDAEASAREALETLERTENRSRAQLEEVRREAREARAAVDAARAEATRDTEARMHALVQEAEDAARAFEEELTALREENARLAARLDELEGGAGAAAGDGEARKPARRPGKKVKTRMLATAQKRYLDWDRPIGELLPAVEELLGGEDVDADDDDTAPLIRAPSAEDLEGAEQDGDDVGGEVGDDSEGEPLVGAGVGAPRRKKRTASRRVATERPALSPDDLESDPLVPSAAEPDEPTPPAAHGEDEFEREEWDDLAAGI
jgi:hypothetical protein